MLPAPGTSCLLQTSALLSALASVIVSCRPLWNFGSSRRQRKSCSVACYCLSDPFLSSRVVVVSILPASLPRGWLLLLHLCQHGQRVLLSFCMLAHAGGSPALPCSRINAFRRFSLFVQRETLSCPLSGRKSSGLYTPSSHYDSRFSFRNFEPLVSISSIRRC